MHACHQLFILLQGFCVNIVIVLAVMAAAVMGYPLGAPEQACAEIRPLGHVAIGNMATGTVPYYVNISSFNDGYVGGQTYTSKLVKLEI